MLGTVSTAFWREKTPHAVYYVVFEIVFHTAEWRGKVVSLDCPRSLSLFFSNLSSEFVQEKSPSTWCLWETVPGCPFFPKSSCICGLAENRTSILAVQKDHVAFFRDFSFPSSLLCCRLISQKQNHVINAVTGSVFVASPVEMIQQCGEELTGSSKSLRFSFKTCWERRKTSAEETFCSDLFFYLLRWEIFHKS